MGLMKNEFESHHILEFAASASKSYAMRMQHRNSGEEKFMIKTKGLRLSDDVCSKLPFSEFKKFIFDYCKKNTLIAPLSLPTNNIQANKIGQIFSFKSFKKWAPIITKGNVNNNFDILPFGYFDNNCFTHSNALSLYKNNYTHSISLSNNYILKYL
jgi:hypothetical protein